MHYFVDEFEKIMKHTVMHQHIPFDFNSNFIKRHFGASKKRQVSYEEFTQILHVCENTSNLLCVFIESILYTKTGVS